MATNIETKRKLRAIRRLSSCFPDRTAEERLEKIEGIAAGKIDPSVVRRGTSPDQAERLKRGMASRSPRNALDTKPVQKPKDEKQDEEKKRKKRGGHDRQEKGGIDRSSDLHG
jgi:hypothetical protein